MKKLTKTQQEVLNKITNSINQAKTCHSYEEYFIKYEASMYSSSWNTPDKFKEKDIKKWDIHKKYWIDKSNNITLVHCNSKTLYKLRDLGYIEILEDSTGDSYGIDVVKLIKGV